VGDSGANVTLAIEDGVAIITLNRPDRLNALDDATRRLFLERLREVADMPAARALVVTGAGRAFCAGGDVKEMPERLAAPVGEIAYSGWSRLRRTQSLVLELYHLEKPTIAAVNGVAAGLGFDLALSCDFIVACAGASFRMAYVLRGLVPDGGGMYLLPRRVGLARAKEIIFSGAALSAEQAMRLGIVDRLAEETSPLDEAKRWAKELSAGAATALAKGILNASFEMTLEESLAATRQAQAICYTTEEHRKQVDAFAKRRAAK
jgi:enoyl-CoA hydratase/carnithine racemase